MRNFPNRLKNKADIYNCVSMVRAGELDKKDLVNAIKVIKNQNYINAQIIEVGSDKKTVTTRYLAEAAEGSKAIVGGVAVSVKGITHNKETDENEQENFVSSTITVSKAVAKDADVFALERVPAVYESYGVTEAELDSILSEFEA